MSNVISIVPNQATADEILDTCKGDYKEILILGWDEEDMLKAKSSSTLDVKEIIYMMEIFKQALLSAGYTIDE